MDLTKTELNMLRELRNRGYAVIIWTPDELKGVNPIRVEDRYIELGHQIIEDLSN